MQGIFGVLLQNVRSHIFRSHWTGHRFSHIFGSHTGPVIDLGKAEQFLAYIKIYPYFFYFFFYQILNIYHLKFETFKKRILKFFLYSFLHGRQKK